MIRAIVLAIDRDGFVFFWKVWGEDDLAPTDQDISDEVWSAEQDGYRCQVFRRELNDHDYQPDPEVELFNRGEN